MKFKWLLLSFLVLPSSCHLSIARPLRGPGMNNGSVVNSDSRPLTVAVTHVDLHRQGRSEFLQASSDLFATMAEYKGFVGGTLRTQPLGTMAWTLTVWDSPENMRAFVNGTEHLHKAFTHSGKVNVFRSVVFTINKEQVANVWDLAYQELDKKKMQPLHYD